MNSYAVRHPRLGVVAIVNARSSMDAVRLLMKRDESWGDLGFNEAAWLGKRPGASESYSLFGEDDCEHKASIDDVIAEIDRRREMPVSRQVFEELFRRVSMRLPRIRRGRKRK